MMLDHIELLVPDRDAAAAWYADWLGFAVMPEHGEWAETGPLMMTNDGGKTMLALFVGPARGEESDRGWRRVAFRSEGAEWSEFLQRWRESGQSFEGPVDHQKAWSIYFSDPWGNRLEATTYDYDQAAALLTPKS